MYLAKFGLIIGFHGCDLAFRDRLIINKATFKPSINDYDWLGSGMYFWENNRERALLFAKEQMYYRGISNANKIQSPAVLGAVIDLGFCLDLLDSEYISMVKESFETLTDTYEKSGFELPENKPLKRATDLLLRRLDCKVIENLHEIRADNNMRPFDSARGVFVEGAALYPNAGFNEKNHIQICIRNPNCIKGFFLPREENSDYLMP